MNLCLTANKYESWFSVLNIASVGLFWHSQ